MQEAWNLFAKAFQLDLERLQREWRRDATEIRMGIGRPIRIRKGSAEGFLLQDGYVDTNGRGAYFRPDQTWLEKGLDRLVHYSLYAYEGQMGQGFLTVEGGHRIGVCGRAVVENGVIKTLTDISALVMRMAHEVKGCSEAVFPYIRKGRRVCHTLILSPPGAGKTTMLRDLLRRCSDELMLQVGIVDERSEIAACRKGIPQMDVGLRTEVLDGAPKTEGIRMLLRSVAPEVIGVDEIGSRAEADALGEMMRCGVQVLCTAHAASVEEALGREEIESLYRRGMIERMVVLADEPGRGRVREIRDGKGRCLYAAVADSGRGTADFGRLDGGTTCCGTV